MDSTTARPPRGFRSLVGEHKWRLLVERGVERIHSPGSRLLRQGDPGTTVMALVSGRVKVLGAEPDGGQLLITLRGAGDLLGEIAARSRGPRTATVEAIDKCTVRLLTTDRFNLFLDEHGGHGALTDYLISKLSQTVPYQLELVHFTPERKIARLLLEIVALADDATSDPTRVPFSQQDLADALGMARSTVAQHLQRLKSSGALLPGPRVVVENLTLLQQAAGV